MLRFFRLFILFLIGSLIVAIAVANRQPVRFILDPFIDRNIAYSLEAPLFVFLFAAMFAGIVIGGIAMWFGQGHWRRSARAGRKEVAVWKREAETLKRGIKEAEVQTTSQVRPLRAYL